MNKKVYLSFFGYLLVSYYLLHLFFGSLVARQEEIDARQTDIIQEHVKDRFSLILKLPLSVAMIGAEHFSTGDMDRKEYGKTLTDLLGLNKEILGLSVITPTGKIERVFPPESNPHTHGKITQNISYLLASHAKGESYWFSPPFHLYQGEMGFGLYLPMIHKKELKGWFVPVMSSKLFFDMFKLEEFLKSYDLVIKDEASNLDYFSSYASPHSGANIYEYKTEVYGRKLVFQSWRKEGHGIYHFPWYFIFTLSLVISLVLALLVKLREQKKKVLDQLREISSVLRLTAREAINKLVDIHSEFNQLKTTELEKTVFSHNVSYVTNLIEQIDLLQMMAESKEEAPSEKQDFLPILEQLLDQYKDIIEKKSLTIHFKPEELKSILVSSRSLPLQNSVVSNILSHSIIYAQEGTSISIECTSSDETYFITFHTLSIYQEGPDGNATKLDRRMNVAKMILQIYDGKLFLQNDLSEGMIIRILLPIKH